MLSETAVVAIAGGAVTVIVAALTSVLAPSWLARWNRKAELAQRVIDLRYERAQQFIDALGQMGARLDPAQKAFQPVRDAYIARNRFVAVLRAGEGDVAKFTAQAVNWVHEIPAEQASKRLARVGAVSDALFGWLRGDCLAVDLRLTFDPRAPEL
jgi:hypothetical protein